MFQFRNCPDDYKVAALLRQHQVKTVLTMAVAFYCSNLCRYTGRHSVHCNDKNQQHICIFFIWNGRTIKTTCELWFLAVCFWHFKFLNILAFITTPSLSRLTSASDHVSHVTRLVTRPPPMVMSARDNGNDQWWHQHCIQMRLIKHKLMPAPLLLASLLPFRLCDWLLLFIQSWTWLLMVTGGAWSWYGATHGTLGTGHQISSTGDMMRPSGA